MSGGVDSSVSAYLLKEQGFEIIGVFMKNWEEDDTETYCPAAQDRKDAEAICTKLDIPFYSINFATEYWDFVFEYFLAEYRAGRTPNPDILCNKEIKFKAFLNYAQRLGCDKIATGHYANCVEEQGVFHLMKAADANKDQTYFLYTLQQDQLSKALFPLAHLSKPQVRAIANEQNFDNAKKKDSTGICFIGERKFKDFLQRYLPAQPGDIISAEGQRLGTHSGLMYYTIGQRQGIGLGGQKDRPEAAWYVATKNLARNELIVVQGQDHPLLFQNELHATQLHWTQGQAPAAYFHCTAKIRYRQQEQSCHVELIDQDHIKVHFDSPQRAVTAGQSIVLYQDMECLGGGVIISG
jgi:tRNA-specific 2-thiouridylase